MAVIVDGRYMLQVDQREEEDGFVAVKHREGEGSGDSLLLLSIVEIAGDLEHREVDWELKRWRL